MAVLSICGGSDATFRTIRYCPICERRRRMAGSWAMWYGVTLTCTGCGDRWMDGEMGPRPFQRGWRAESIKRAKAQYAEAALDWRGLLRVMRRRIDQHMEDVQAAGF